MRPYRGMTEEGNWVYGWYKEDTYGKPKILAENPEDYFLYWFFVLPETVGQSIGLKDKNGKEIFEGDILDDQPRPRNAKKWKTGECERLTIEYDEGLTRFLCHFWTVYGGEGYSGRTEAQQLCDYVKDGYIVIGNIHDNPDLLKK